MRVVVASCAHSDRRGRALFSQRCRASACAPPPVRAEYGIALARVNGEHLPGRLTAGLSRVRPLKLTGEEEERLFSGGSSRCRAALLQSL